jgi:hypothetical protein
MPGTRRLSMVILGALLLWIGAHGVVACGPPWSQIIAPSGGVEVTAPCQITVRVVDAAPASITVVQFLVDGAEVGTDSAADEAGQFASSWDCSGTPAGEHLISATATRADGTVITASDKVTVTVVH